ncbi:MAG: GNAT family N-acetyltransferase [Bacilli bacterium]
MIHRCKEVDRSELMNYLQDESSFNLFFIGNIEQFGFDSSVFDVWMTRSDGRIEAVMLRYLNNYVFYTKETEVDISPFRSIIGNDPNATFLSGKPSCVGALHDALGADTIVRETYFCELQRMDELRLSDGSIEVKKATGDDAHRIVELLLSIEEFHDTNSTNRSDDAVLRMRQKIEGGSDRVYFVEEDGTVVSVVQTAAENSMSAMIIGVATHAQARGRGLMSAALTQLCQDVLSDGKSLCLFYDNEAAGCVYHRLGFQQLGMWTMMVKKK